MKDGVKMGLRCMGQNMNDLEKTRDFRRFNVSSNSNFGGENRTYGTCMNISLLILAHTCSYHILNGSVN